MVARWLPLLALLLSAPALAETSPVSDSLAGSWALEAGGTTIFRFDLTKGEDGKWQGTWSKPSEFASDGNTFSHLSGPTKKFRSMTALETPDGLELSFADPTPGSLPDIFDFKPIDADAVEMVYVGTDLAPYTLERVKPGTPLGPWKADTAYSREPPPVADKSAVAEAAPTGPAQADEAKPAELPSPAASGFRLKPGAPVGR